MTRETNYFLAAHWLNNSLVLCNQIPEIDDSIWDNMRFDLFDEDESQIEIYQWFITDCSESDVEWLEKSFGLLFTYSDLLECYILCVDHWGTSWDYVYCPCYNDDISDDNLKRKHRTITWSE